MAKNQTQNAGETDSVYAQFNKCQRFVTVIKAHISKIVVGILQIVVPQRLNNRLTQYTFRSVYRCISTDISQTVIHGSEDPASLVGSSSAWWHCLPYHPQAVEVFLLCSHGQFQNIYDPLPLAYA